MASRKRVRELVAGGDVGKDSVDFAVMDGDGVVLDHKKVLREVDAIEQVAKAMRGSGVKRLVVEASGGFERLVAHAFHKEGVVVSVVNPVASKAFAKSIGVHAKTDRVDAKVLARYGLAHKDMQIWEPRPAIEEELQNLVRARDALIKQRVSTQNMRRQQSDPAVRAALDAVIATIKAQVVKLEKKIAKHIKTDASLRDKARQLETVPGIGTTTSAILLAELPELGRLPKKQIASLAGVAPYARDSGKKAGERSIRGGRERVRRGLWMAATVATKHNPVLSVFAQNLLKHGKPPKKVTIAVIRKLLHILNAMVANGTDWDPNFASSRRVGDPPQEGAPAPT